MVGAESRSESLAVALSFLEVEFGLEEGSRLEVEFVREGVVQCALDTGLIGIVGAFKGCRCTGEVG